MKYEILDDGIFQISLDNGKANVVSLDLANQMITLLDKAEEDGKGVLLCGSLGMFSAGFDFESHCLWHGKGSGDDAGRYFDAREAL